MDKKPNDRKSIIKIDAPYQSKRSKREDTFIYRPDSYPGPVAIDMKPSKECDDYHKNSCVEIYIESNDNDESIRI